MRLSLRFAFATWEPINLVPYFHKLWFTTKGFEFRWLGLYVQFYVTIKDFKCTGE